MSSIKFALIKNGKITLETELNKDKLTIGPNLDCDILVYNKNIKKTFTLIKKLRKNYQLQIPRGSFAFIYYNNKKEKIEESTKLPPNSVLRVFIDESTLILIKLRDSKISKKELSKGISSTLLDLDPLSVLMFIVFVVMYVVMIKQFSSYHKKEKIEFAKIPKNFEKIVLKTKKKPKITTKNIHSNSTNNKKVSKHRKRLRGRKTKGSIGSRGKKIASRVRSAGLVGIIGSSKKSGHGAIANLLSSANLNKKLSETLKTAGRLKIANNTAEAKARLVGGSITGTDIGDLKTYTGKSAISYEAIDVNAEDMFGEQESVSGSGILDSKLISKVLQQHAGGLQFCYNKELRRNPYLEGKFSIEFTIKINGRVSGSSVKIRGKSKISRNMQRCIKRVFSRIIFPAPKGSSLTIRYPINFEKTT